MADVDRLRAVTNYVDAYNRRDIEGMLANCTDDYVTESIAYGKFTSGKFAVYELLKASFSRWVRSNLEIKHMVANGQEVVAEMAFTGIKVGSPQNIAFREVTVFEFRDKLIARDRWYHDRATVMEQLGQLPPRK